LKNEHQGSLASLKKSIELGLVESVQRDNEVMEVLKRDPGVKGVMREEMVEKGGSLPRLVRENNIINKAGYNSSVAPVSLATKMGKLEYYHPKLSRKIHIKESLPCYKSTSGIFSEAAENHQAFFTYKRKVGKGIDLSEVLNNSYSVSLL
jgi:hypothetical protein